ncbi:MAG: VCBS repeat-containing protein, partial [Bacteroidota bacterium]
MHNDPGNITNFAINKICFAEVLMTVRQFFYILVFLLAVSGCKRENSVSENAGTEKNSELKPKLFKKISPEDSGVVFSNQLTENLETIENLFNFDYFYNGAGVGVEDLNNDGLLDIFFCGNQVENRLFMNRGDMTFEDVTANTGINAGKVWSNGVTFADVNQDGWMDIYVSQGGPNPRLERKNLLFINQKNETFLEQANTFGLDDMGISTQSSFFDMDRDGDLDCVVMNENELYGVDPINLYKMVGQSKETEYFNSSHLYRNDNGKFVDVTKSAGLERPIFGLGLMVSDINNDGWSDIYMASDYYIPDALFINNKNGTFSDRIKDFTNQISYYGMGMDVADLNNDAKQEIFVLDMASSDHFRAKTLMASMNTRRFDYLTKEAGFHYQYMFNSLQLNLGNDQFNNIAQLTQTAKTDWSWSVLMSDFDLDGHKDIFVTNGYRRYALDNDLQQKVYQAKMRYGQNMPLELKRELYNAMPSEKLPNIMYQNNSGLRFTEIAREWGLGDFSFSNGAAAGDLDNDGDLDLVVNNMDEGAFLYQNTATEQALGNFLKVKTDGGTSESPARITITYGDKTQFIETK